MTPPLPLGHLREREGRKVRDPDLGLAHLRDSVLRVMIWGFVKL